MKNTHGKLIQQKPLPKIRFAVLLLAALILSGCRNPLNGSGGEPGEPPMGTFLLTVGGRDLSRIVAPVWPEAGELRFYLRFRSPDHADVFDQDWNPGNAAGSPGDPIHLYSGIWDLTVKVYHAGEDSPERLIATGGLSGIVVGPGDKVLRPVTLNPIGIGDGTFAWNISVPHYFTVYQTRLQIAALDPDSDFDPVDETFDASDSIVGSRQTRTLPGGVYKVTFAITVEEHDEDAVIYEVLYVHPHMTSLLTVTLGDLHFPETLLGIILGAWEKYDSNPADGSVRAYLFNRRGLRPGHFPLLDVAGVGGPGGLSANEFDDFLGFFDSLTRAGQTPDLRPRNLEELQILTDAALVGVGGNPFEVAAGTSWPEAENAVRRQLSANNTPVSLVPTRGPDTYANVGSGKRVYRVPVRFTNPVYDFAVRFLPNGATTGAEHRETVYKGHLLPLDPGTGFSRTNYAFAGWNTRANGGGRLYAGNSLLAVTESLDLFATWIRDDDITPAPANATVSFLAGGGTGSQSPVGVPPGTEILLPFSAFVREGHVFVGWGHDGATYPAGAPFEVAENVALTAVWSSMPVQTRTITLMPNHGTGMPIVMTVPQGTETTLPVVGFARQWHTLAGWSAATPLDVNAAAGFLAPGSGFTVGAENAVLYAVWHRAKHTVTFDTNDGLGTAPTRPPTLHGGVIILPDDYGFDRPGYNFVGWNTLREGGAGTRLGLTPFLVLDDVTLFAEWVSGEPVMRTVTFAPNGGVREKDGEADVIESSPVPHGIGITLPAGGFVRENHVLVGWSTETAGGTLLPGRSPFTVTGDVTLYASWVYLANPAKPPPFFTVSLNPNGGTEDEFELSPVPHGTHIRLPAGGFTRPGQWALVGWATSPTDAADMELGGAFTVFADVTLYAVWREVTVTSIVINPPVAEIMRGDFATFTAIVTGTNNPPKAVVWHVEGADNDTTYIPGYDANGNPTLALHVAGGFPGQTPGTITVRAESVVNISPPPAVAAVTVPAPRNVTVVASGAPGNDAEIFRGESWDFTATVDGDGYPTHRVRWEVTGANDASIVSIGPENAHPRVGRLTLGPNQNPGTINVRAVSIYGDEYFGSIPVTVSPPRVLSLEITGGPASVQRGEHAGTPFTVAVTGRGNPDTAYTWSLAGSMRTVVDPDNDILFVYVGERGYVPGVGPAITALDQPGRLTVVATSVNNPGVSGSRNVAITGTRQPGNWSAIRTGQDHTMAIMWGTGGARHGQLYTWGRTAGGNPMGHSGPIHTPGRVGNASHWRTASGGYSHTLAITNTGELWAWGQRENGRLGIGGAVSAGTVGVTRVGTDSDWIYVAGGNDFSIGIRGTAGEGRLYAWGANARGQLGDGTTTQRITPVRVAMPDGETDEDWSRFVSVSAGHISQFAVAVRADGTVWAWGQNNRGQLGPGHTVHTNHETAGNALAVAGRSTIPVQVPHPNGRRWITAAAGDGIVVAIDEDDNLWTWGNSEHGKRGLGPDFVETVPSGSTTAQMNNTVHPARAANAPANRDPRMVPHPEGLGWYSVNLSNTAHHILAIDRANRLWSWGQNTQGQLGRGRDADNTRPGLVMPNARWMSSDAGGWHSMGVQEDGSVWVWGRNHDMRLGLGATPKPEHRASPHYAPATWNGTWRAPWHTSDQSNNFRFYYPVELEWAPNG